MSNRNEFENLFYTHNDKMLFWVAGYTADNNTSSVVEILKSLQENAEKFAKKVGCKLEDVKTFQNNHPPRYQYMRVFYIETETPHPDAFVYGDYEYLGKKFQRGMHDVLRS